MSTNKDNIFRFSYFDPLHDELPDYLRTYGNHILINARTILKNRTNKEIYSAAEIIWWMVRQDHIVKVLTDKLFSTAIALDNDLDEEDDEYFYICPFVEELLICSSEFDISNYEDFKNATWPELFAVLALGMIADGFEDFTEHQKHHNEVSRETYSYEALGCAFIEATESMSIAKNIINNKDESPDTKEKIIKEIKNKQRLQGQRDAIKRHSNINNLKRECYEYFCSIKDKDISKRQAAHDFYESLPRERKRLLAPTNATRTLAEGITYFEKRHISS